jgi:Mannosyltransferase (PIG-V)
MPALTALDSSCRIGLDTYYQRGVLVIPSVQVEQAQVRALARTAPLASGIARWLLRTSPLPAVRLARADWLSILAVFVLSRALILGVSVLATALFPAMGAHHSFALQPLGAQGDWTRLFAHFDSGWYIGVSHGYPLPSSGDPNWLAMWEFFPLYPVLLHPVALGLAGLHLSLNVDVLAGVLVSYAAFFGGLVYLYRLVAAEVSLPAARRTIYYLAIFPAAIYFSAVYPEALFLLLTVGAFYHMRRRQWALTGLLTSGALLTRPQGLFLLVPLALEFMASWRAARAAGSVQLGRQWLGGLWLGLPLVTLGGYALYSHAETGYWLAFAVSAANAWGHRLTPPLYPFLRYVLAPSLGNAFSYDLSSVNIGVATIFLVLVVLAFRRLPPAYGVWLAIAVLFPLSTSGHYLFSYVRYAATAFPAFVTLAMWSLGQRWTPADKHARADADGQAASGRRWEWRDRLIVTPSLLLLAVYIALFVNGYPAGI